MKHISTMLIQLAFKTDNNTARRIDTVTGSISRKFGMAFKGITFMMGRMISGMADMFEALFSRIYQGMSALLQTSVGEAMQKESQTAKFTALMGGDGQMAQSFIKRIDEFSLSTSYATRDLYKWASMLKAMNLDEDAIMGWLSSMGNVAGGDNDVMNRMLMNVGQIFANNRAYGLDIKQFGFAGIPIKEYLAETMGITNVQVGEMVSSGKIGYKQILDAFHEMTKDGGRYSKIMSEYLKTTKGKIDVLKKKFLFMARDGGDLIKIPFDSFLTALTNGIDTVDFRKSFEGFMESLAMAFRSINDAVSHVFGQEGSKPFQLIDKVSEWLVWFGESIELLAYLFFGIPEEYKKAGLTKQWIKDHLGISGIYDWFEKLDENTEKYLTETLPGLIAKGIGYGIGQAIVWLIKMIGKSAIGVAEWFFGHLAKMTMSLFGTLAGWMTVIPGMDKLSKSMKEGAEAMQAHLNKNNSIEKVINGSVAGFIGADRLAIERDSVSLNTEAEQTENVKKEDKKGDDVTFNIYTDESRSMVAEQLEMAYGQLA